MANIYKSAFIIVCFCLSIGKISAQGWTPLTTTGSIPERTNASAIYDPSNNRMIVFGGGNSGGTLNDMWSLDLNTNSWSEISTTSVNVPGTRYTHICTFDSTSNRILLWSGSGSVLYNDVWAFNLNDSTWEELFPDGNVSGAPLKRYGNATTFDPVNRNIVTFAGFTTSGRFDDTWSFNVDNMTWTENTNATFPLLRCLTSQSFAPERREMIVYGGQSTGNLDDIWSLNMDTYNWTNLTPVHKPIARHFASAAYCGYGNVVIFGGNTMNQGNTNGAIDDLWSFNLDTQKWDTIPQGSLKPSPRYGHTYIHIPSQDKMIIFGGQGVSSIHADTWVYSGISSFLNNADEINANLSSLKCFPNPSDGNSSINFTLTKKTFSTLTLIDINGKILSTLLNSELTPGNHSINLSSQNLSPGIYLCSLRTGAFVKNIRLIIIETDY